MIKFVLGIVICLLLIVFESNQAMGKSKIGFGISFNPLLAMDDNKEALFPKSYANFYLPVQDTTYFMYEFEFGIQSQSSEIADANDSTTKSTNSLISFGIGGFYTFQPEKSVNIYIGPRISIALLFTEEEYYANSNNALSSDISQTILNVGAVFGGEYYLSNYFSLGLEAQLNVFTFFEPNIIPSENSYKAYRKNQISTNWLIFARIYFN